MDAQTHVGQTEVTEEFVRLQRHELGHVIEGATRDALHAIRSLQAQLQRIAEALDNDQDVFITDRLPDARALGEALTTRAVARQHHRMVGDIAKCVNSRRQP